MARTGVWKRIQMTYPPRIALLIVSGAVCGILIWEPVI